MGNLSVEEKEVYKKQIESFKEKIYWELQNNETNILVFGNDRIASCCGDINDVIYKLACMVDQLHRQTGIRRKELIRGIKDMCKVIDNAKNVNE